MFFLALPPFAVLVEAAITTAVCALVTLATQDAYDKMTRSGDDQQ